MENIDRITLGHSFSNPQGANNTNGTVNLDATSTQVKIQSIKRLA